MILFKTFKKKIKKPKISKKVTKNYIYLINIKNRYEYTHEIQKKKNYNNECKGKYTFNLNFFYFGTPISYLYIINYLFCVKLD